MCSGVNHKTLPGLPSPGISVTFVSVSHSFEEHLHEAHSHIATSTNHGEERQEKEHEGILVL